MCTLRPGGWEWARGEAGAFGGDSARGLLLGESAGAIAVGLHLLTSGGAKLRVTINKQEFFIPALILLRALRAADAVRKDAF